MEQSAISLESRGAADTGLFLQVLWGMACGAFWGNLESEASDVIKSRIKRMLGRLWDWWNEGPYVYCRSCGACGYGMCCHPSQCNRGFFCEGWYEGGTDSIGMTVEEVDEELGELRKEDSNV